MRIAFCSLGFLVFAFFTYLQRNDMVQYDTDKSITIIWILAYASVALLSLVCAIQPLPNKLFWAAAAIPAALALLRFSHIDWSSANVLNNPANPAAHETAGLIAMALWIVVLRKLSNQDVMC